MSDLPRRGSCGVNADDRRLIAPTDQNCAAAMARTGVDGVQEPTRTETDDALQMPPHRPHRSIRWIAGDGNSRSLNQQRRNAASEKARGVAKRLMPAGTSRESLRTPQSPGLPIRSLDKSTRNPIFAQLDRAIGLRQSVAPAGHDHYAARRGGARDVPQTVSGGERQPPPDQNAAATPTGSVAEIAAQMHDRVPGKARRVESPARASRPARLPQDRRRLQTSERTSSPSGG